MAGVSPSDMERAGNGSGAGARPSAATAGGRPTRTFKVEKAVKEQEPLRLALVGYEGQGKTLTALKVATRICERQGGRIILFETEGRSSKKYADLFDFDRVDLQDHSPEAYVDALHYAEDQAYRVVIFDSFSHEHIGEGGLMEVVDDAKARGGYGWDVATKKHREVTMALVNTTIHVIATLRQKKAYIKDIDDRGRERMRQAGLAAETRPGTEYEFDVIATLQAAVLTIEKARDAEGIVKLGQRFDRPGADFADLLLKLVTSGAPAKGPSPDEVAGIPDVAAPPAAPTKPLTDQMKRAIEEAISVMGPTEERKKEGKVAIASTLEELGYRGRAAWSTFLATGHDDFVRVLEVARSYDRSKGATPAAALS